MLKEDVELWKIQQWLAKNQPLVSVMRFPFSAKSPQLRVLLLGDIEEGIEGIDFNRGQRPINHCVTVFGKKSRDGLGICICTKSGRWLLRETTEALCGEQSVA
jgi:hypothetical protein